MLIFMLSIILISLKPELYLLFRVNRFINTKRRRMVRFHTLKTTHSGAHRAITRSNRHTQEFVCFLTQSPNQEPPPKTNKTSRDKTFLTRYSNSLLKANIVNINDISHYPSNIFSILGINVTSAGNQSTEPNCIDVSHLAASCSSK